MQAGTDHAKMPPGQLRPLIDGEPILGFTPVYQGEARFGRAPIRIYRFPPDYAGAAALRP